MTIGLFFGSFNPIHTGHLIIANTMLEYGKLSEVWFVVSPQNPFKISSGLLHEFDRFEMVRLAIHDNFKFRASDIEFQLTRPSYTIDTLTYLQEKYPMHQFRLIIGEDNLQQFPRWKNYEKILDYFSLLVYQRPTVLPSTLMNHPKVTVVEAPQFDISASFIRNAVKAGRSIKYLVPQGVEEYIKDKKFFI
jgi:nicotinate-nucleotide adenylyltransferase